MNKQKLLSITMTLLLGVSSIFAQKQPVDYVNPLMGTDSKISLSNGNTYPAIALPWGMNFWMPQTGQLNWPVPVLAVSGVVLFAFGWALDRKYRTV